MVVVRTRPPHRHADVADGKPEHMGEMFDNARKQTLQHYRAILQNIHEKPSIIAQTYNATSDASNVVSLRPLFLCLQCPSIMTEADRDLHFETKSHCFCGCSSIVDGMRKG
jgi:ubiquitin carboxyl-terminal hydrolase 22/27/51